MIPALLKDILPSVNLQEYVGKFQVFRFIFPGEMVPPAKYHLPTPEHCITFYVRDVQRFSYVNIASIHSYPRCVINGVYTVPLYRYGGNDFLAIKAILKPSALYQLIKLPLTELTNRFINAEDIWGNEVRLTCERLQELDELSEMISVIEKFIEKQIKKIKTCFYPFDRIPNYILNENNDASIDWLANQACLSVRQFIRKFEERMGISTKTFERIIRFNKAHRMRNRHPEYDWLSVAIACDYHDYQHMVRDFKEFTKFTPASLYEKVEPKGPERFFGFSYPS